MTGKYDYSYEVRFVTQEEDRKKINTLPRVFKLRDLIREQEGVQKIGQVGGRNHIFGQHTVYDRLTRGPLYSFTCHYRVMNRQKENGQAHRHQAEAMFYVVKGKGFERHDGVEHHYEEGDLVAIPQYTIHSHFCHPEGAEVLIAISRIDHFLGLYWREQHKFFEKRQFNPGLEPIYNGAGKLVGYHIGEGLVSPEQKALEVKWGVDKRIEEIYTSRLKNY